ncbi:MAG TPA: dicarboxylate/amino acid:cation symporter [Longimicrobiales bacterium]|nr:dicarboxylate/amino acid:cation symporter [Longimicrobiales bacterium]
MADEKTGRRGIPLHTKILIGLIVGAVAGVTSNYLWRDAPQLLWIVDNIANPVGQIFLRMLFMVVVPLVFTSLALGVAGLGDIRSLGRIGGKTFGFFVLTTALAVTLGLLLANAVRPGDYLDPVVREGLLEAYSGDAASRIETAETTEFGVNTFVNIVPRNPLGAASSGDMLGLIFFTVVFGVALTRVPPKLAQPVLTFLEGFGQAVIVMIGFAMKLAPIGVTGLIFAVTARFGLDVLGSLSAYVLMVLAGLTIHLVFTLGGLAKFLGGIPIRRFFSGARDMMITAFSTSSSNATMPTTLRTAQEEFGVPREVAGFVVPLGATMNMNGTALFEGMTVLFLAQVFGLDLSLTAQLIVVIMSVITAIGVAGVPGGSIPLLVMVLEMVGVPGEGIALVLGVDRILDMARTVPNVTGDLLTSIVITRSEGLPLVPATAPDFSDEAAVEVTPPVIVDRPPQPGVQAGL